MHMNDGNTDEYFVNDEKICLNITFDNFANTGGEIRISSRTYKNKLAVYDAQKIM